MHSHAPSRRAAPRRPPPRRAQETRPPVAPGGRFWAGLRLAITLLTAVPLPGGGLAAGRAPDARTARAAMYWAPVVGLALGGVAAGVLTGCQHGHTGSLLAAVLALAVLAALTREIGRAHV